jgi:hypothetical protein
MYPGENISLSIPDHNFYYDKFKYLSDTRFVQIIKQLYDTWKYKRFPLVADFVEAQRQTAPNGPPEYKSEGRIENVCAVTAQKEYRRIIRGMDTLTYLEKRCEEQGKNWRETIKKILRSGKVYNVKTKQWFDEGTIEVTNDIFEPRKYYPPEYYL